MSNGISFIFGYNMATMTGGPMEPGLDRDGEAFDCESATAAARKPSPACSTISPKSLPRVARRAPSWLWVSPPTCWDGKTIDVADHRSHVVYGDGPMVASAGQRSCPVTIPIIPNLAYQWYFTTNAAFVAGQWRLSSDDMISDDGQDRSSRQHAAHGLFRGLVADHQGRIHGIASNSSELQ